MISGDWKKLTDVDGQLERILPDAGWVKPNHVKILDGKLHWLMKINGWKYGGEHGRPDGDFFDRFLRLADASDQEILAYAEEWGVLEICEHGWPASHRRPGTTTPPASLMGRCRPLGYGEKKGKGWWGWEPFGAWRYYARQAIAILNVSAQLISGKSGSLEDLWILSLDPPRDIVNWRYEEWQLNPQKSNTRSLEYQRIDVDRRVNQWIGGTDVHLYFNWRGQRKEPAVGVTGHGLFGSLAFQLAAIVGGKSSFAQCDGCATWYKPEKRRPREGERHYCASCRKRKIPIRDAARALRDRKKKKELIKAMFKILIENINLFPERIQPGYQSQQAQGVVNRFYSDAYKAFGDLPGVDFKRSQERATADLSRKDSILKEISRFRKDLAEALGIRRV